MQLNEANLVRLVVYFVKIPAKCIQLYYKSNHILFEQVIRSNIVLTKVVLKCVQPSV